MFRHDEILPPDPEGLEVLHDREYRVRAFRLAEDRILIRGAVRDQKPPGIYLAEDPNPLTMHHMQVDLYVAFPSMVIESVDVDFEEHPHTTCVDIVESYQGLVGLSITRGFTHKVRELFGGPGVARTRRRCCWRWVRSPRSARGRCMAPTPAARGVRSWPRAPT